MLINRELFEMYFKKDSKDNFANMDIHMFSILNEWIEEGSIKNQKHKTFTFAYYWLISYLWKYGKYGERLLSIKEIKTILGSSPIEKRLDYIVKKKGLLDVKGYTEATKDYPIYSSFGESNIELTMLSDIDEDIQKELIDNFGKNYFVKKPIMMLQRKDKNGLMFSNDDALKLSIFEFTRIVLCQELGVDGFYVYSWLKLKAKMSCKQIVNVYYSEMESDIGFKERRLRELLKGLEDAGLIKVHRTLKFDQNHNKPITKNSYELLIC